MDKLDKDFSKAFKANPPRDHNKKKLPRYMYIKRKRVPDNILDKVVNFVTDLRGKK